MDAVRNLRRSSFRLNLLVSVIVVVVVVACAGKGYGEKERNKKRECVGKTFNIGASLFFTVGSLR